MKTADLVTLVPMNQIWQALKVCQTPSSNCLHKDYASSQNMCFEVSIPLKIYCAESIRSIYAYIKAISILWRLWPKPHFCECNCNDSNCCVQCLCSAAVSYHTACRDRHHWGRTQPGVQHVSVSECYQSLLESVKRHQGPYCISSD